MSWLSDQLSYNINMADIDKIVREAENRHSYKEQCKESNSQLKDSIYEVVLPCVVLPLMVGLSALIVIIIEKVAKYI